MSDFSGKRLLILGGAFQHCKLVEVAKEMGVITYVVDYLPIEKAPAKQISDYHYQYNITDYDAIVDMCRTEHIDGILSSHLDACQVPYQVICERLDLPCFGTKEQFHILTDKTAFIQKCIECGVDVIPQYSEEDFIDKKNCSVEFPVFVKPCDSRGSRGQNVCCCVDEMEAAINYAKAESKIGKVVIEKYMGGKQDFSVTYFFANGHPYVVRLCDRYVGKRVDGLDKQCITCIAPSKYSDMYMKYVDQKIINMIQSIGIKNGPVFMQGFIDGNTVRMYDPGLRFPGGEYERLFTKLTNISFIKPMIEFALSGEIHENSIGLVDTPYMLNGNYALQMYFSLKPVTIKKVIGIEKVNKLPYVLAVAQRYHDGDEIKKTGDVRQRLCEIAAVAYDKNSVIRSYDEIVSALSVKDEYGNEMLVDMIDPTMLV